MRVYINFRRLILWIALWSVLTPVSARQVLLTLDWAEWNAVSQPRYPDETWEQYATPEEAGWSSEELSLAEEMLDPVGSAAVIVLYDGVVLTQWGQVERPFDGASMRKSLLSALYGIAVAKGEIDIDETIGSIGIDEDVGLTATEKSAKVSNLLKSRSGIYLPAAFRVYEGIKKPARGSHKPGTHWYYNNWDFNALGTIYNRKTSRDLIEDFQSFVAKPLQMEDFDLRHTRYRYEANYSRHPDAAFRMSARDLARFGLLFLNDGRWKGQQVVPVDWVRASTQTYSRTSNAGCRVKKRPFDRSLP